VVDGCVWGRGSLDDKGGVAMSLSAFLRATAEGLVPPGDVVLAILCDEEAGGWLGARYLVDNHSEQFAGVRYAIGETGGFAFHLGGCRFYLIMVAEENVCVLKATVRGPTAHAAAVVVRGGAAARLGSMLTRLDQARLPVHVTSAARGMFERMSSNVPFPARLVLRQLLKPTLADKVLDLLGPSGQAMYALLHNTANVTEVHGGEQAWGTPAQITATIAACLLPGYGPEDVLAELRRVVGDEVEFEIVDDGEIVYTA